MTEPSISDYSAAQIANAEAVYSFWRNYVSEPVAIGFVANVDRETSLRFPAACGDSDSAVSIEQWHADRVQRILANTGIDVRTASLENCLVAAHRELTEAWGEMGIAWETVTSCTTPESAAIAICRVVERAGAKDALNRSATLAGIWDTYFKAKS